MVDGQRNVYLFLWQAVKCKNDRVFTLDYIKDVVLQLSICPRFQTDG